jgi:hypothetical protein
MSSDGGKGSSRRPDSVDRAQFDANWDAIFKRKTTPNPPAPTQPQNGDIEISRTGQTLRYHSGYWTPTDYNHNNSH